MQAWWAEEALKKTIKILLFKNFWLVVCVCVCVCVRACVCDHGQQNLSRWGIFVAIAKNTLYGLRL